VLKKNALMVVVLPLTMLALPVAATTFAIDRADASVSQSRPDARSADARSADAAAGNGDLLSVAVSLWGATGIAGVGGMIAFGVAVTRAGQRSRTEPSSRDQGGAEPRMA
jgi:hypothetical protein